LVEFGNWHFGKANVQFGIHWCLKLPLKRYRITKRSEPNELTKQQSDNGSSKKKGNGLKKDAAPWGKLEKFLVNTFIPQVLVAFNGLKLLSKYLLIQISFLVIFPTIPVVSSSFP